MAMQCPQKLMYFLSSLGPFRTALMIATMVGDLNIIQTLHRHGADLRCVDSAGYTATMYSRMHVNPA